MRLKYYRQLILAFYYFLAVFVHIVLRRTDLSVLKITIWVILLGVSYLPTLLNRNKPKDEIETVEDERDQLIEQKSAQSVMNIVNGIYPPSILFIFNLLRNRMVLVFSGCYYTCCLLDFSIRSTAFFESAL